MPAFKIKLFLIITHANQVSQREQKTMSMSLFSDIFLSRGKNYY